MKVMMLNGSPHEKGCTYTALTIVAEALAEDAVNSEIFWLGNGSISDCTGCMGCKKVRRCVQDEDIVNQLHDAAAQMDGFVFASPVYYANPTGRLLSVLNRLFFQDLTPFRFKPGAAVLSARRAGECTGFDAINKYFTISQMPIVSSSYWNNVHGTRPADVLQDAEGVQTLRTLGHNMAWLLKSIDLGRKAGLARPEIAPPVFTNFIR